MDEIVLTKENLDKIVKGVIGTAPESIIHLMVDKLETEGSNSVINYLHELHTVCQDVGSGSLLNEFIEDIVHDNSVSGMLEREGDTDIWGNRIVETMNL